MSDNNIIKIIYVVSVFLFVVFSMELFISIESYIHYFSLAEKISTSFRTSVFLFTVPAVFYLLYLLVFPPSKKRTIKGSKKIMFSFLFSLFSYFLFLVCFLAFSFLTMLKEIYFLKVILFVKKTLLQNLISMLNH